MVKIMERPIKMDDLGVPLFLETPIYGVGIYTTGDSRCKWVHLKKPDPHT